MDTENKFRANQGKDSHKRKRTAKNGSKCEGNYFHVGGDRHRAESHRISEQRRRNKVNSTLEYLKNLLPPHYFVEKCEGSKTTKKVKADKASLIGYAIQYITELQEMNRELANVVSDLKVLPPPSDNNLSTMKLKQDSILPNPNEMISTNSKMNYFDTSKPLTTSTLSSSSDTTKSSPSAYSCSSMESNSTYVTPFALEPPENVPEVVNSASNLRSRFDSLGYNLDYELGGEFDFINCMEFAFH